MGGESGKYYFHGDVLITPKSVFTGADAETTSGMEGGVHAFDTSTGQQRWKHSAGRGVLARIVGTDSRLFVPTINGEFLCLDGKSGKPLWSQTLQPSAWELAAVQDNRVFVGSRDGNMYALNSKDGAVEWRTNIGSRVTTSIVDRKGSLYAGTHEGFIHRIDVRSGKVISSIKADTHLKPTSLPVLSDNALIVLLTDDAYDYRGLVSLDLDLSKVQWSRADTNKWSTSRIFLTKSSVFLGRPGEIVAYNVANGKPSLSFNVTGTIRAIGGTGDVIYAGTTEGFLYAVQLPAVK